jgi:hypothetical protein
VDAPAQPAAGDATEASSRDLEEEEHLEHLEVERSSKHNVEQSSRPHPPVATHGKGPMGESSMSAPIMLAVVVSSTDLP